MYLGCKTQVYGSVRHPARPSQAGLQTGEGEEPRGGVPARVWVKHERTEG